VLLEIVFFLIILITYITKILEKLILRIRSIDLVL